MGYFFSLRDYQAALEMEGELPEEMRQEITSGHYVISGLMVYSPGNEP